MSKKLLVAKSAIFRMLDANYNRAKEGIRVSEDVCRFLLSDVKLAKDYKKCRHDLTKILLKLPVQKKDLLEARDVGRDQNKTHAIKDKSGRSQWQDVMTANIKRSQEAVRVLEECAKVVSPKYSKEFLNLRFRLYDIEKRSFQKF